MSKMKESIADLTYLDGVRDGLEQGGYNRGFEQGKYEERQRIIAAASFTVKLSGNRVILDSHDWANLWRQLGE